jgi:hypothetical protein
VCRDCLAGLSKVKHAYLYVLFRHLNRISQSVNDNKMTVESLGERKRKTERGRERQRETGMCVYISPSINDNKMTFDSLETEMRDETERERD